MHPVGPLSPRVYWVRRVGVIAAAVVVLVALVFLVAGRARGGSSPAGTTAAVVSGSSTPELTGVLAAQSPASGAASGNPVGSGSAAASGFSSALSSAQSSAGVSAAPPATSARASRPAAGTSSPAAPATKAAPTTKAGAMTKAAVTTKAAATTNVAPTTKAAQTTKPAATTTSAATTTKAAPATAKATPPAPSTDAQGRLLCPDAAITLQTTTGAPSYRIGSQPVIGVTVTNVGSASCVRDLSGSLQVFTVSSTAGRRLWSTADCFPGVGTDVRVLNPGESLQYNVRWSGTTSNPGCQGDRVQVGPGHYVASATIGSLRGKPVTFELVN